MNPPRLISTGTAAKILGVTRRTITRWCNDGTLQAIRTAGKQYRVVRESIDMLLAAPATPHAA